MSTQHQHVISVQVREKLKEGLYVFLYNPIFYDDEDVYDASCLT